MNRIKSVTHLGLIILAIPLVIVMVTFGVPALAAFWALKEMTRIEYGG